MFIVAKRIIRQIFHDKRSMTVMIVAPLLLLTLIYFLLGKSDYKPTVALDKKTAQTVMGDVIEKNFEKSLSENEDIKFSILPENTDIEEYIKNSSVDAVITFKDQDINIIMLEQVAGKINTVTDALKTASNSISLTSKANTNFIENISPPTFMQNTSPNYVPKVALKTGSAPVALENSLKNNKDIELINFPYNSNINNFIKDKKADAVIEFLDGETKITMLKQDMVITTKVSEALSTASSEIKVGKNSDVELIFGSKEESTFDSLAYYLLGVLSFFIIFIFSGISFVRERTLGTLERLMRTPIKSSSIVVGYSLGFSFFAIIQSVLLILYAKFIINTPFLGKWWLAMIVMLMIAIVAVMMGIFVSIISKNEFQVVQLIPLLIIPQIFFSGLIPIDMLPYSLDIISYILPLYYGGMALKNIMVYGYGMEIVWPYVIVLLGFIMCFFILNVLAVKKSRRS